jgi:hypothetical protein
LRRLAGFTRAFPDMTRCFVINERLPARPELSVFKVNEEPYIEVAPALQNLANDKLIHIGFATADARKLRDYCALPPTTPSWSEHMNVE